MKKIMISLVFAAFLLLYGCSSNKPDNYSIESPANTEPNSVYQEENDSIGDVPVVENTGGMTLSEVKSTGDSVCIQKQNGQFYRMVDYPTIPGFTAIEVDVEDSFVFAESNNASFSVLDRSQGDTLVLLSDRGYGLFPVVEQGWGCLKGMSANDSNSFASSDGPAMIGGIQINASDDYHDRFNARENALADNGVRFRGGYMVGDEGVKVVYSWYSGVDYREFTYNIDTKYFVYSDPIKLDQEVTKEGYFYLNSASLDSGLYVFGTNGKKNTLSKSYDLNVLRLLSFRLYNPLIDIDGNTAERTIVALPTCYDCWR